MRKMLTQQHLESLSNVIADTNRGLTKDELSIKLGQSGIEAVDDGSKNNGMYYQIGLSKRKWLYNCLVTEYNKKLSFEKIYIFLENVLNNVSYSQEEKRDKYNYIFEETNKILLLIGLQAGEDGKISEAVKAKTLNEVDRRVSKLKQDLYHRAIHHEVQKYCVEDYLRKDYYDAVFEASKSLAQRVRDITGLASDGFELFQTTFSTKEPYIYFNTLTTPTEKNEHNGLCTLLQAIVQLVRNPTAHTPKINWKADHTKALDILTVISFAHKYLDECYKHPNK